MKLNVSKLMMIGGLMLTACQSGVTDDFKYTDEKFADIQMLRYKVEGFEQLTLDATFSGTRTESITCASVKCWKPSIPATRCLKTVTTGKVLKSI